MRKNRKNLKEGLDKQYFGINFMSNTTVLENYALLAIKFGISFFLLVYLIFAIVVIRQVKVMTSTLKVGFELQLKTLAYIHFAFTLFVLVISVLSLIIPSLF